MKYFLILLFVLLSTTTFVADASDQDIDDQNKGPKNQNTPVSGAKTSADNQKNTEVNPMDKMEFYIDGTELEKAVGKMVEGKSTEEINEMILAKAKSMNSSGKHFISFGTVTAALGVLHPYLSGTSEYSMIGTGTLITGMVTIGAGLSLCAKAFKASKKAKQRKKEMN